MLGADVTFRLFDDYLDLCVPLYFCTVPIPIISFDVLVHADLWELLFLQGIVCWVTFCSCVFSMLEMYLSFSLDCFAGGAW